MNRKYLVGLAVAVGVVAVPFLAYAVMSSLVVNGNATIGSGYTSFGAPTDGLLVQGKLVVGSSVSDSAQIKSAGVIESTSGGFKFPDGTTQMTAASVPTQNLPTRLIVSDTIVASIAASVSTENTSYTTLRSNIMQAIGDVRLSWRAQCSDGSCGGGDYEIFINGSALFETHHQTTDANVHNFSEDVQQLKPGDSIELRAKSVGGGNVMTVWNVTLGATPTTSWTNW